MAARRGRPAAPREITDYVVPVIELSSVDFSPKDLYKLMDNKKLWIKWLASHRLIKNSVNCSLCARPMGLCVRSKIMDNFFWRCRYCKTCCNIRKGSFFERYKLSTETIVMLMFYWLCEVKAKHVMRFEGLKNWNTIVSYNNSFRMECYNWLLTHSTKLGGLDINGQSIFVEVDESYFFRRKYNRGQKRPGVWVVGLVERGSGRCWLQIVARRNATTLERIICDHVLPGTTIVTDAWRGYNNVNQLNGGVYEHLVVVHQRGFVHFDHSEIHTQTIEGLWMQTKRLLRYQGGTSRGLLPSYLAAFQWRNSHRELLFGQYMQLLSENFNI
jgi:hypothetical protein